MNKTCARCEKTVYPTEELKCLDKVWHKGCFKCQECGMTLNMRTYKGYGKLPYCEAHVPKAKHTTMAETPELKRIAENTKLQSNVNYHADFERSKGKFTQVADDPETLRIKANTKIISNVAYHGDLEKKAQMEKQRQINENGEIVDPSSDNYHQQLETYATEMLPPPNLPQKNQYQTPNITNHSNSNRATPNQDYYRPQQKYEDFTYNPPPQYANPPSHQTYYQNQSNHVTHQTNHAQNPITNHAPQNPIANHAPQNPITNHAPQNPTQNFNSNYYAPPPAQYQNQYKYDDQYYQYQQQSIGAQQKIGRIQDYDPVSDGPRQPPSTQRASTTLIYKSVNDGRNQGANKHQQQSSRAIGRVTDLDPLADDQGRARPNTQQKVYIAMYDYEANDSDEVSFHEGDLISNVTSIDSGWMTGQVLRTGRTGMLPANYVELAPNSRN